MSSENNLAKMGVDFARFSSGSGSSSSSSGSGDSNGAENRVLLKNVMIIYSPRQLVSQWRDTVCTNLKSIPGINCEVMTSEDLRSPSYNVDKIKSNPNKIFVYILHHSNYKRYFFERAGQTCGRNSQASYEDSPSVLNKVEYTVGMLIVDEADSESFTLPGSHVDQPVAMYTLLVTATACHLGDQLAKGTRSTLLSRLFHNDTLSKIGVCECIIGDNNGFRLGMFRSKESTLGVQHPDFFIRELRSIGQAKADMIAQLAGMNVVSDDVAGELSTDMSRLIPDMNCASVRCAGNVATALGIADNTLIDGHEAVSRFERELDLKIHGVTVEVVRQQLADKIATLERAGSFEHFKLQNLRGVLHRLENIESECGVCMCDFSGSMLITSCCSFFICKDCYKHVNKCPKCRSTSMNYVEVSEDSAPPAKKLCICSGSDSDCGSSSSSSACSSSSSSSGAGAGAGTSSGGFASTKQTEWFMSWFQDVQFRGRDHLNAVELIADNARRFGLTHIIIAGSKVNEWHDRVFGRSGAQFYGYNVVRPNVSEQGEKRSTKKINESYRLYCSGGPPSILVLDTVDRDSVELTGIDAGCTDLVIEVGEVTTRNGGHVQLAGRAMRFGRNSTSPIKITLL